MTDTISFRPTLLQHGYSDGATFTIFSASLGDFAEAAYNFNIPAGGAYAAIYDFGVTNDAVRGIQQNPRNFFTQASQSQYFTMSLGTTLVATRADIGLQYQTGPTAAVWEATDILENATDWQDYENPVAAASTTWVLNGSTYDLIFNLDFNTQFGTGSTESIKRTINKPTWNGLLSLNLPNSGAGYTIQYSTVGGYNSGFMAGQYVPFHTGWDGIPASRGRPVLDMKTGLPSFAEDLVEDGYLDGIWTVASQADPLDPRDLRDVVFPDDEGTRKDDVPA